MSKLDGRGFVPADFDRDGDLDLFVFNNVQPVVYLRNDVGGPDRHWLTVQLRGTEDNRFGIGAKLRLTAGGATQLREMRLGSGYLSGIPLEAHFGLGDSTRADRLEITWPNGDVQVFDGLDVDRVLRVTQGAAAPQDVTPQRNAAAEPSAR